MHATAAARPGRGVHVSMESGLEGRNNWGWCRDLEATALDVSMESGLEGRNNAPTNAPVGATATRSQWSPV